MHAFLKTVQAISDRMKDIGAACLIGMTVLTCADVVGRYFKHPIFGSVELVSYMAVLAVTMSLPYTHATNGHIGVEILVRKFSLKAQRIVDIATHIASLAFFGVVSWRMFLYAASMRASGEVSMNLQLPEYLVIFVVALSFVAFSLIILKDILELLTAK